MLANTEAQTATDPLGDSIRRYRLRLRQIHSGTPWAQEDLAVAIGSDKSHVNRIERNRSIPTRATIERIATALCLTWDERVELLAAGGFVIDLPAAASNDVERVRACIAQVLAETPYGVVLKDRQLRTWDMNDIAAFASLGFPNRETALTRMCGMSTLEELLDDTMQDWRRRATVDYELYATRQLACCRRLLRYHCPDRELRDLVRRVEVHAFLGPLWRSLSADTATTPVFLDHQFLALRHPQLGNINLMVWHSSIAIDERFFLSHHVPADHSSQRKLDHLRLRFRNQLASNPERQLSVVRSAAGDGR